MKPTDLKTRVRFPSTINKDNLANLRRLSKTTRIPMSVLIDQGLEMLFEHYERAGILRPMPENQEENKKDNT